MDITDWTVICTANWSWHPHQSTPVVKKTRPQSMFYKDAPFTKLQEETCGLSARPWRPNSTAVSRSWRRQRHSSPERPWSCSLRTPRRRRKIIASQFRTLDRKPHGSHRARKTASQVEQQHDVNSAGHTVTDGRKQRGARHCCYSQSRSDEQYPEKYRGITFLPLPKPKRRLEDCQAGLRACGRPHDQALDQHTRSAFARQRGRS